MNDGDDTQGTGELQWCYTHRPGLRRLSGADSDHDEHHKWSMLTQELTPGLKAGHDEFVPLNAEAIIAEARAKLKNRTTRGN